MTLPRIAASAAVAALVLFACGSNGAKPLAGAGTDPTAAETSSAPVASVMPASVLYDPDLVLTTGGPVTVIEGPKQPTTLCLGAVMSSLPPQCGGPRLVGFDWDKHRGDFEEAAGVKFGAFLVEGRYDGKAFTVTKVVRAKDVEYPSEPPGYDESQFATPCPTPPGGWKVLDAGRTNEATQERTFTAAETLPGYADAWVDQSRNPLDGKDPVTEEDEMGMNDPKLLTINVRVTKDVAGAERALRKIWGGALCVTKAVHTDQELEVIQNDMQNLPGITGSDRSDNKVNASVEYDDGSLQTWADQKYGKGLVEISGSLQPVKN